ncbi:leucine zipper protein 1 [Spea bombifrons]|uniref:leucine zipper protein 1 n=1 Tax=Spea bombifrons TaxID=233779 RepID=UPI00234B4360|nr:leucine zipper protein 1 [Spea bombifrons]
MDHTSRHLRFKLQSLGRRLDDLEEATKNLQKAEDEVLDLQDKIIQAEGSNSSMLADVEALRKRVQKIEGKDEEVKKAEDLCRLIKEKLENEENLTRELRAEIEWLQKKMTELEKLEEAFNKSKNDCSQLWLSLNEEKNMSKKFSSELELLRARVKELECSESKLDKAEQFLTSELEKIKSLTINFVSERKHFIEKEKQNEKLILDLKQQLELKMKVNTEDETRKESNLLERSSGQNMERNNFRIEDNLNSKSFQGGCLEYIKQSENQKTSKNQNDKNKPQEDNKIRDLNQEIEKLKNQLKHFEGTDEELRKLKEKNRELQETCFTEQNKNKQLVDELQALKKLVNAYSEVKNGDLTSDEITSRGKCKNERTKYKAVSSDALSSRYNSRDLSPPHLKNERHCRKPGKSTVIETTINNARKEDDTSVSTLISGARVATVNNDVKRSKDQPSVLSRYPPAVQERKSWKVSTGKKPDRFPKLFTEDDSVKVSQSVLNSKKGVANEEDGVAEAPHDTSSEHEMNSNQNEKGMPVKNCSLSSTSYTKPMNSELEVEVNKSTSSETPGELPKADVNSEERNVKDATATPHERLSRYSHSREDRLTNYTVNEQANLQRNYVRDNGRSKISPKPEIPEKPHILETDRKDPEKRYLSGLHARKQPSTKLKSSMENAKQDNQTELESEISRKMSSDGFENTEPHNPTRIKPRSYSPRESLQSAVTITPIVVERDTKVVMGDYDGRSNSETRSQINATTNKVSSIKFYPSDVTPRIQNEDPPKERHTSVSRIRISANDQPVLNNISIPFEISIKKDGTLVNVEDCDSGDNGFGITEISKASDKSLDKELVKTSDHSFETVTWKRHSILDSNHLDNKQGNDKKSWRKSVLGSTEELDILIKERDTAIDSKYKRKSFLDEEKPLRVRRDQYLRKKTSSVSSWTNPEFISERSKSSLTATEIIRRNISTETFSSELGSWNRFSIEDEDFINSRRKKYGSEKLTKMDSAGKKPSSRLELQQNQRHQKGMVEERIRQLEH